MLAIFTVPLLFSILAYSIYKIIKSITSKNIGHLKPVVIIWILPTLLVVYGVINSPKSINKSDVVGTYEIDAAFYPGKMLLGKRNYLVLL